MKDNLELIKKILKDSLNLKNVNFYWLTGSIARGQPSNNIDVITGLTILNQEEINILSERIFSSEYVKNKPEMFDDALRFKIVNGMTISLGLYGSDILFSKLRKYTSGISLNGEKRPWALNSWLPESFCADVNDSLSLYDKNDLLKEAKRLTNPYPEMMINALTVLAQQEIELKVKMLDSKNSVERMLAATDIITCILRSIFAQNRKYLYGFKNIPKQLLCSSAKMPRLLSKLWEEQKTIDYKIIELKKLIKEYNDATENNRRS